MKTNLWVLIWLCVAILISSCRTTGIPSEKSQWKSIYIEQFKLTYLRSVLAKSYNRSQAIQEIISLDHSGFTEPVLTDNDYKLIDSLTTADNETMKVDSTEGNMRAEGAEGKRPLQFIMKTFNDKSLEKLAKKRFKMSGLLKEIK